MTRQKQDREAYSSGKKLTSNKGNATVLIDQSEHKKTYTTTLGPIVSHIGLPMHPPTIVHIISLITTMTGKTSFIVGNTIILS